MIDRKQRAREAQKRYREKNRAKINDENSLYRLQHPEQMCQWRKEWNKRNAPKIRKAVKKWSEENPEKVAAEMFLNNRRIEPAASCELCPEDDVRTTNLQKHHPDHSYPEIFVTACGSCHKYAEEGV